MFISCCYWFGTCCCWIDAMGIKVGELMRRFCVVVESWESVDNLMSFMHCML